MGTFNYIFACNLHAAGFIRCRGDGTAQHSTANATSTADTLASPHICANLQHCQLPSVSPTTPVLFVEMKDTKYSCPYF